MWPCLRVNKANPKARFSARCNFNDAHLSSQLKPRNNNKPDLYSCTWEENLFISHFHTHVKRMTKLCSYPSAVDGSFFAIFFTICQIKIKCFDLPYFSFRVCTIETIRILSPDCKIERYVTIKSWTCEARETADFQSIVRLVQQFSHLKVTGWLNYVTSKFNYFSKEKYI